MPLEMMNMMISLLKLIHGVFDMGDDYRDLTYMCPTRKMQRDSLYECLKSEMVRKRGMNRADKLRVLNLIKHKVHEGEL